MNNIFTFATKELSQDAFLCWSINWLTEGLEQNNSLFQYGKAMLDLFLAEKKQNNYYDVKVINQYKKIDVLVMYKDKDKHSHALIIEDKTNTSEHGNQMLRYKNTILKSDPNDEKLKDFSEPEVHLSYIKTGIMYDEDARMVGKGATVIDLEALLEVVSFYSAKCSSEILSSFCDHIQSMKGKRTAIATQIENGQYESALQDAYGQYYFLNKIFDTRSKGALIGYKYVEHEHNIPVFADNIYSGTNNGGTPWTQYCFRGEKYPQNLVNDNENEYHYLFWRIDCKWRKYEIDGESEWRPYYYIALRHYDEHAHSKNNDANNRKVLVYRELRRLADEKYINEISVCEAIGIRENYKESDLIFIPIKKIQHMGFEEIKQLLLEITAEFKNAII